MMFSTIMNLLNRRCIGTVSLCNRIHTTAIQYHGSYELQEEHARNTSLAFTYMPKKSMTAMIRSGKRRVKGKHDPMFVPRGPLLISCRRKEYNYYAGMHYGKMTPVPLASKGWHKKTSNGDYFSILGSAENTSFPSQVKVTADDTQEATDPDLNGFKSLGVNDELVERMRNAGFHYPTRIQFEAIPKLLVGKNLVISGETGCGKTLAYVVPILDHIMRWKSRISEDYNSPLALIVVPNRELALQVGNVVSSLITGSGITSKVVLAEYTKKYLMNFSDEGLEIVDIVVSTVGVMCKLTFHKVYKLGRCLHLVLDEADTLLDDSFSMKIRTLMGRCKFRQETELGDHVPRGAQLSLVSATIPKQIEETLKYILPEGAIERLSTKYLHRIPPHIRQNFVRCKKSDKPNKVLELVKEELTKERPIIVFSNYTKTCNWLAHFFRENGIECARLNKRMNLEERVTELKNFKEGRVNVLTCTDIVSRGHDIPRVNHVINYEFPTYVADYVHRCGRTGRIGNNDSCEVTSFISRIRESAVLNQIEMATRTNRCIEGVNNNIKRLISNKARRS